MTHRTRSEHASNPWQDNGPLWRRLWATQAAWFAACLSWQSRGPLIATAIRTPGALSYAAVMVGIVLLDVAIEVVLARAGIGLPGSMVRATRAVGWLLIFGELALSALLTDFVTKALRAFDQVPVDADDIPRASRWPLLTTTRAVAYAASSWVLLVIPVSALQVALAPDWAEQLRKYGHLLLVLPTALAVSRSLKETVSGSGASLRIGFILFALSFYALQKLVDSALVSIAPGAA